MIFAATERLEGMKMMNKIQSAGCPYCNPETPGVGTDIHRGNQLDVGYGVYREINYCPMCGGKLEPEKTNQTGNTNQGDENEKRNRISAGQNSGAKIRIKSRPPRAGCRHSRFGKNRINPAKMPKP